MKNKRGQIALFVILAVVIVAALVIFLLLRNRPGLNVSVTETDPKSFVEKCVKDSVNEAVDKMLPQGGFLEPRNYKIYNDSKVEYLCENKGDFRPCINQHSMLLNEIKMEILNYSIPRTDLCIQNMKIDFEGKGYNVEIGEPNVSLSLGPDKIFLNLAGTIKISKDNSVRKFDNINIEVINPVYNLANIAIEIVRLEAQTCYFNYVGYSAINDRYLVKVTSMSDSTKIYIIEDKNTNKEMMIAIRGCAIPPGM